MLFGKEAFGKMSSAKAPSAKKNLSYDDRRILVSWMEIEENFKAIHGAAGKTSVGGKPKITRAAAFGQMAKYLKKNSTSKMPLLSSKQMSARWDTYKAKFKSALDLSNKRTGAGVSKEDFANSVSFPEMLEKMCPHFERMRALFGERPNVKPSTTMELGTDTVFDPSVCQVESVSGEEESCDGDEDQGGFFYPTDKCEGDDGDVALAQDFENGLSDVPDDESGDEVPVFSLEGFRSARARGDFTYLLNAELPASPTKQAAPVKRQKTNNFSAADAVDLIRSCKVPEISNPSKKQASAVAPKQPTSKQGSCSRPQTAHDSRVSLSAACAANSDKKIDYLNAKLEQDRRQWKAQQEAATNIAQAELEMRARQLDDAKEARRQLVLLELVKQNKSATEIAAVLALL